MKAKPKRVESETDDVKHVKHATYQTFRRMFDNGYLPMGHMHSTPLQIAFERGIPALIAWIAWMYFYLRMLWRSLKNNSADWLERGLLLGCLGGSAGFLASSLVHYNWGDSEVIMVFYLLMGLSLALNRMIAERQ